MRISAWDTAIKSGRSPELKVWYSEMILKKVPDFQSGTPEFAQINAIAVLDIWLMASDLINFFMPCP